MRLVEPKINFNFYNVDYCMGKRLVLLEITAAYLQPTSFSDCEYVRIGSYKMSLKKYPNVERKLWYTLNQVSYEQAISPIQKLHFNQMNIIANSKGVTFNESKLLTLHMVNRDEKFNNLAFLLSDENTHIVKFAVYRNESYDFDVKKEFKGSWLVIVDQVLEYANVFNDTSAKVIGSDATRTEIQSYPDPSLREMILNCFCHFDANIPSDIKIEFFPNKVVIASPGSLYKTSMNEILKGRQSFRNPNLVYVLSTFHYIENYATSFQKLFNAYKSYNVKPIIEATENFFVVTLPNINKLETVNVPVNATAKEIYSIIKNNPIITLDELFKKLNKNRTTIYRNIKTLKEKGFIKRVGSDKTGYWVVLK